MPQTVPNGPDDTATFGHSTQYSVSLPTFSSTVLKTILFRLDAQTYTITVPAGSDLTVEGHGIIYDFLPDGHYIVTDPGGIVILTGNALADCYFLNSGEVDFPDDSSLHSGA